VRTPTLHVPFLVPTYAKSVVLEGRSAYGSRLRGMHRPGPSDSNRLSAHWYVPIRGETVVYPTETPCLGTYLWPSVRRRSEISRLQVRPIVHRPSLTCWNFSRQDTELAGFGPSTVVYRSLVHTTDVGSIPSLTIDSNISL